MAVFAISDLHLPARVKPMDVFGEHWKNHFDRIRADWTARVSEDDIVLLPGDLSWAMHLEEAQDDLDSISALPGVKLLLNRIAQLIADACSAALALALYRKRFGK